MNFDLFLPLLLTPEAFPNWKFISNEEIEKFFSVNSNNNKDNFVLVQNLNASQEIPYQPPRKAIYQVNFTKFCSDLALCTNASLQKQKLIGQNLKKKEIKIFFGILNVIEEYPFCDYRLHFEKALSKVVESSVQKKMSLSRFDFILKNLSYGEEEEININFIKKYNDLLEIISKETCIPDEYLIVEIKKFDLKGAMIVLLFDRYGCFLKGRLIKKEIFEHILKFQRVIRELLQNFFNKNHTIILPPEAFTIEFVDRLRKKKIFCLTKFNNEYTKETIPDHLLYSEILILRRNRDFSFAVSDRKKQVLFKTKSQNEDLFGYLFTNSFAPYDYYKCKPCLNQFLDLTDNYKKNIENLTKISFQNIFKANSYHWSFDLIILAFKLMSLNAFFKYSADWIGCFDKFKELMTKHLISLKIPKYKRNSKIVFNNNFEGHYIDQYPSKKCKVCLVCRKENEKKRKTSYRCIKCEVPLCAEICFKKYHLKKNFYDQRKKAAIKQEENE